MRRVHLAVMLMLIAASATFAQDRVAIKGARILSVSGPAIEHGVILINNGKIEAVGKDVAIPAGVKVIDAAGKVIVPGFIEAHGMRGMDQVNENNPNVPFLSVVDAIDPSQEYFEECRREGITTVAISPGNNTVFGGQAAILKTAGNYISDMIVKPSVGIKISLKPTNDRNRMGCLALIRKELDSARDAIADKAKAAEAKPKTERKEGEAKPLAVTADVDDTQPRGRRGRRRGANFGNSADTALVREALTKLLKGDLMAFIYCELAMDVPQAIKLVKEYKLKAVLVLGQDCYKAVKQVAASKLPVVLDSTLVFWETDPRTGEEKRIALPKIYRDAGVPVTFQVAGGASGGGGRGAPVAPTTLGANFLWYQAATAVKHGMPAAEALAAITLRPAQVLGVEKRAGSIEVGKDADLAILSSDPLKLDTWVEKTIVGGKVVYDRAEDRKLKALLKPKE